MLNWEENENCLQSFSKINPKYVQTFDWCYIQKVVNNLVNKTTYDHNFPTIRCLISRFPPSPPHLELILGSLICQCISLLTVQSIFYLFKLCFISFFATRNQEPERMKMKISDSDRLGPRSCMICVKNQITIIEIINRRNTWQSTTQHEIQ